MDYFVTCLMLRGKKIKARNIFLRFVGRLRVKYKVKNFELFFKQVFDSHRPLVSLLKRKMGSVWYSIPSYIRLNLSRALIVRWFIMHARSRMEYSIVDKLYNEFVDFYNKVGRTIKYVEWYHNLARDNMPFVKKGRKRKFKIKVFRLRKYHYYF
jgi:ribosomal protein S7